MTTLWRDSVRAEFEASMRLYFKLPNATFNWAEDAPWMTDPGNANGDIIDCDDFWIGWQAAYGDLDRKGADMISDVEFLAKRVEAEYVAAAVAMAEASLSFDRCDDGEYDEWSEKACDALDVMTLALARFAAAKAAKEGR